MNERIRQLAEEAVNAVQSRPNGICDMNKYNQKFAELIVRECAKIASYPLGPTDEAYCYARVVEHFGFEDDQYEDEKETN